MFRCALPCSYLTRRRCTLSSVVSKLTLFQLAEASRKGFKTGDKTCVDKLLVLNRLQQGRGVPWDDASALICLCIHLHRKLIRDFDLNKSYLQYRAVYCRLPYYSYRQSCFDFPSNSPKLLITLPLSLLFAFRHGVLWSFLTWSYCIAKWSRQFSVSVTRVRQSQILFSPLAAFSPTCIGFLLTTLVWSDWWKLLLKTEFRKRRFVSLHCSALLRFSSNC